MWKHALAAAASVSALVAGVAVPGALADEPTQAHAEAAARVAVARAVAAADERQGLTADDLAVAAAVETLAEHRAAAAEAARVAAEQAAAEAARVAAEQAAAEAAAQAAAQQAAQVAAQQAAATKKPAKRPATSTAGSSPARPAAPAPPAQPAVAWSTTVVDSGGQDAVDRCLGGLTHWYENVDGKPYYPIHRGCGGTPILGLHLGDRVKVDGTLYVVTDARDVPKGAHYSAASGLNGQILLQTCYRDDSTMRIVALTAA